MKQNVKKVRWLILPMLAAGVVLLCILLFGVGKTNWQAQYDLGQRYLSQGHYNQAVIAFTAAIELDMRRPEAYAGRAHAYLARSAEQQDLELARQDYGMVLELLPNDPQSYLQLIELNEQMGDEEAAQGLRQQGFEQTGDQRLEPVCVHVWSPADYQHPQTCELCGQTKGEPLAAALADREMMQMGYSYDYLTQCAEKEDVSTLAQVVAVSQELVPDETHEFRDGYVWKKVEITVTAQDDNAWEYGIKVRSNFLDYYTGKPLDDQGQQDPEAFQVNYVGQNWTCLCRAQQTGAGWDGRVFTWSAEYEFLVPQGYDGCVIVLYDGAYEPRQGMDFDQISDGVISDSDTLYCRVI